MSRLTATAQQRASLAFMSLPRSARKSLSMDCPLLKPNCHSDSSIPESAMIIFIWFTSNVSKIIPMLSKRQAADMRKVSFRTSQNCEVVLSRHTSSTRGKYRSSGTCWKPRCIVHKAPDLTGDTVWTGGFVVRPWLPYYRFQLRNQKFGQYPWRRSRVISGGKYRNSTKVMSRIVHSSIAAVTGGSQNLPRTTFYGFPYKLFWHGHVWPRNYIPPLQFSTVRTYSS